MTVKTSDYMYYAPRATQINISVPKDKRQSIADALDLLKRQNPTMSKSALFCQALLEKAERTRQK